MKEHAQMEAKTRVQRRKAALREMISWISYCLSSAREALDQNQSFHQVSSSLQELSAGAIGHMHAIDALEGVFGSFPSEKEARNRGSYAADLHVFQARFRGEVIAVLAPSHELARKKAEEALEVDLASRGELSLQGPEEREFWSASTKNTERMLGEVAVWARSDLRAKVTARMHEHLRARHTRSAKEESDQCLREEGGYDALLALRDQIDEETKGEG